MKKETNRSDINKMNNIIFKKIMEQFETDLTPNQFISTARLALTFQKNVQVNEVSKMADKEMYENIMSVLDRAKMKIVESED
jgi:hypothetical protein